MLKFFLFVLVCLFPPSIQNTVEELDKTCQPSETCIPLSSCPTLKKSLKDLKKNKDYKRMAKTMNKSICNMKEKAVCCPPEEEGLSFIVPDSLHSPPVFAGRADHC